MFFLIILERKKISLSSTAYDNSFLAMFEGYSFRVNYIKKKENIWVVLDTKSLLVSNKTRNISTYLKVLSRRHSQNIEFIGLNRNLYKRYAMYGYDHLNLKTTKNYSRISLYIPVLQLTNTSDIKGKEDWIHL